MLLVLILFPQHRIAFAASCGVMGGRKSWLEELKREEQDTGYLCLN